MILTIKGPENASVEITRPGTYHLRRAYLVTQVQGPDDKAEVVTVGHTSISKEHLKITIDDKVSLLDSGSTLGSFLNGVRFTETTLTAEGQYDLQLGQVKFKLNYKK